MALKSLLFRGDAKLKSASTSNSGHIVKGAMGEHVRKIQYALANVGGENLKFDGKYGPATAAAVLSFKRRYNIVNRTYQSEPDDIVGVMTNVGT